MEMVSLAIIDNVGFDLIKYTVRWIRKFEIS